MLSTVFADLIKIHGVEAVILYDGTNKISDSWKNSEFKETLFKEIGLHFRQILSLENNILHQFPEVVVVYEKGQIFAKLHDDRMLIVITKKLVEVSLLRLVVNVGFYNFDHSKTFRKTFRKEHHLPVNFLKEEHLDDVEISLLKKIEQHPIK